MEFYILEVKNDYEIKDEYVKYCLTKYFKKEYYNKNAEYTSYVFKFDNYSIETENDILHLNDCFNYYDNNFFPNMILYTDLDFNNFALSANFPEFDLTFNNNVKITLNNEIFITNSKYDDIEIIDMI